MVFFYQRWSARYTGQYSGQSWKARNFPLNFQATVRNKPGTKFSRAKNSRYKPPPCIFAGFLRVLELSLHTSAFIPNIGTPKREFLYVDDLADGLLYLLNHFNAGNAKEDEKMFVNIGVGEDVTIKEVAEMVKQTVGYEGCLLG